MTRNSRGYDAGKKINGRKRFIVTGTLGPLIVVVVLAASVQDRDGAKTTLLSMYLATPVRFVFAERRGSLASWSTGPAGSWPPPCTSCANLKRPGFAVIPRRWAVERAFAWLTARRRLARGRPATRYPRWRWTNCR